nr:hypothetical protein GTC16762_27660 [Pigmentibacter ruber]
MFEQLLKIISLESLILVFKEKNLFQEFQFHHETQALKHAEISKISDSDILRKILPKEISSKMFGSGNLNLLAFIFALRHKIVELNSLFHLSALKLLRSSSYLSVKNEYDILFGKEFSLNYQELENYLHPNFWGQAKSIPIVGFSAVGCHFVLRDVTYCRAFDAYSLPFCNHVTSELFCSNHLREKFWGEEIYSECSVQAKIAQFYLNIHNFKEIDEESLKKILDNFFHYFDESFLRKKQATISPEKIKDLLNFYSFSTLEELKIVGGEELRKRFLEKAKYFHPDKGGSQDRFREARENYENLRELLTK